jgi:hypothetical protein
MKKLLAASALLFASTAFAAPNLAGQWSIHNNIAGNESDQQCTLAVAENKVTGSCKTTDSEVPVTGAVDGNKVTWKYDMDYNGTPLTLTYTATLDDSGKIAGTVEVQPFGVSGDFIATPANDAPAAK